MIDRKAYEIGGVHVLLKADYLHLAFEYIEQRPNPFLPIMVSALALEAMALAMALQSVPEWGVLQADHAEVLSGDRCWLPESRIQPPGWAMAVEASTTRC